MAKGYKVERLTRQNEAAKIMMGWAVMREINYVEIQPWQIRLSNDECIVDIFPQQQKYHDIKNNVRGQYSDLIKFLSDHFLID